LLPADRLLQLGCQPDSRATSRVRTLHDQFWETRLEGILSGEKKGENAALAGGAIVARDLRTVERRSIRVD
jgi:hypothetical protein